MKPTRAEAEKLVGKRTPLPGGPKQLSPQMIPKKASPEPEKKPKLVNFTNPKAVNRMREEAQGMKCGGKVKRK